MLPLYKCVNKQQQVCLKQEKNQKKSAATTTTTTKKPDGNFRNEESNNPNENPRDKLHSRMETTTERMSDLENRMMEMTQYEQQKKKID